MAKLYSWETFSFISAVLIVSPVSRPLADVTEPFGVVCIIRSVRSASCCWRPAFSFVTASILPSDQAHVCERENHAHSRKCHLNDSSSSVPWTLGRREKITRADARLQSVLSDILKQFDLRNGLGKSYCKRHRDGTP